MPTRMRRTLETFASILPLALLVACSSSGGTTSQPTDDAGDTGATPGDAFPDAPADETASPSDSGSASDAPVDSGPPGAPITAPDETWTWIPIDGSACGNGTSTGIGVNLTKKSTKVLIYLEGGGACWDALTCGPAATAANLNGYGQGNFDADVAANAAGRTPMNRTDATNPFADYSYVYVPYCTGDVHAGNKVTDYGSGLVIHHVGHENVALALKRLVPTFPDASYVVLSGSSAGGFGATFNFLQVQTAFGAVHVDVIDDAGPPVRPPYMKPALAQKWFDAWGMGTTLPADCTKCNPTDGFWNALPYLEAKYPGHKFSLLSSLQDQTIRTFLQLSATDMEAALRDFSTNVLPLVPDWRVYYVPGQQHTFLGDITVQSEGVTLSTWLGDEVSGSASWTNVIPP